jgi:hypothetical protein
VNVKGSMGEDLLLKAVGDDLNRAHATSSNKKKMETKIEEGSAEGWDGEEVGAGARTSAEGWE